MFLLLSYALPSRGLLHEDKAGLPEKLAHLVLHHGAEEFCRKPEEGFLNDMHRRSSLPAISVLLCRHWGQP